MMPETANPTSQKFQQPSNNRIFYTIPTPPMYQNAHGPGYFTYINPVPALGSTLGGYVVAPQPIASMQATHGQIRGTPHQRPTLFDVLTATVPGYYLPRDKLIKNEAPASTSSSVPPVLIPVIARPPGRAVPNPPKITTLKPQAQKKLPTAVKAPTKSFKSELSPQKKTTPTSAPPQTLPQTATPATSQNSKATTPEHIYPPSTLPTLTSLKATIEKLKQKLPKYLTESGTPKTVSLYDFEHHQVVLEAFKNDEHFQKGHYCFRAIYDYAEGTTTTVRIKESRFATSKRTSPQADLVTPPTSRTGSTLSDAGTAERFKPAFKQPSLVEEKSTPMEIHNIGSGHESVTGNVSMETGWAHLELDSPILGIPDKSTKKPETGSPTTSCNKRHWSEPKQSPDPFAAKRMRLHMDSGLKKSSMGHVKRGSLLPGRPSAESPARCSMESRMYAAAPVRVDLTNSS